MKSEAIKEEEEEEEAKWSWQIWKEAGGEGWISSLSLTDSNNFQLTRLLNESLTGSYDFLSSLRWETTRLDSPLLSNIKTTV